MLACSECENEQSIAIIKLHRNTPNFFKYLSEDKQIEIRCARMAVVKHIYEYYGQLAKSKHIHNG